MTWQQAKHANLYVDPFQGTFDSPWLKTGGERGGFSSVSVVRHHGLWTMIKVGIIMKNIVINNKKCISNALPECLYR